MSPAAVYATRLAALPRALAILELHPAGLPLAELAAELRVSSDDLREVFLAYYLADLAELGNFGQPVVEFFAAGSDDEDVDPATASWVRVLAPAPQQELGVEHLTAEQLGRLFEAGADLLALEPENDTLRSAIEAFAAALWPGDGPSGADWKAPVARLLHEAATQQRKVRITYVRQWHPGTTERVIEPYRLVRTRRGWEVDAGPADDIASVRTYLVSGIESCEVLEETFEQPTEVDRLLAEQRSPTTVELVVPQERRWAVDRYAEAVTVLDDDEESVSLRAELLPPVGRRLGLLLLCCGPEAFVVSPRDLEEAGRELSQELLDHHTH